MVREDPLAGLPDDPMYTIRDLDQLKVLSDPLRLRILEQLCLEARTTKQVSEALGEPATRLYHHVEALESAGLIRLVHTRPKRGTLEKYYQAVARGFRADPELLSGAAGGDEGDWRVIAARLLENTAQELRVQAPLDCAEGDAMVVQVKLLGSDEEIAELRAQLADWVARVQELGAGAGADQGTSSYRLTAAFFPLTAAPKPTGGE